MTVLSLLTLGTAQTGDRFQIDYVCERNHASVDWSQPIAKSVDLAISRIWMPGKRSDWAVTRPAALTGSGRGSAIETDVVGGGERVRWTTPAKRRYSAKIMFSDIPAVSLPGSATLWLEISRDGTAAVDKMTCGPASAKLLNKGQI